MKSDGRLVLNPVSGTEDAISPLHRNDSLILIADSLETVQADHHKTSLTTCDFSLNSELENDVPRNVIVIGSERQINTLSQTLGYFLPQGSRVVCSSIQTEVMVGGISFAPLLKHPLESSLNTGLPLFQLIQSVDPQGLQNTFLRSQCLPSYILPTIVIVSISTTFDPTIRVSSSKVISLTTSLDRLTADENPWRYSARELNAVLAKQSGDMNKAEKLLNELTADESAPQGIRLRAKELLAGLAQ